MVIQGYRISETTDLAEIESIIQNIQNKISSIRKKEYQRLLGKEIAFYCDLITLNILQRPVEPETIGECALEELNKRIQLAQMANLPSPYNLQIFLHIMQLDGKTYLRVDSNNTIFKKAFRTLDNVSVSESECQDPQNAKNILWQKLCKKYEKELPLSKNLTTDLYPDWEHIKYPDISTRCEDFARQNIISAYLSQLGRNQPIPPYLLVPYVDEAMEYLVGDDGRSEYHRKVIHLKNILLDLNADDSIVRGIKKTNVGEEDPVDENNKADL